MLELLMCGAFVGAIAVLIIGGYREWRAEKRDRIAQKRQELERIYRRSRK